MQVLIYSNTRGLEPFEKWLKSLKDKKIILRIRDRISRIEEFDVLGDCKKIGEKIYELRFHFSAGYRVYFCYLSEKKILLLCGGDKSSQCSDIIKAKKFLEDLENG